MTPVQSSNLDSIGHDPETNELHVRWKSGAVSVYDGVSPEIAAAVVGAESPGKALHRIVKPHHPHRYL